MCQDPNDSDSTNNRIEQDQQEITQKNRLILNNDELSYSYGYGLNNIIHPTLISRLPSLYRGLQKGIKMHKITPGTKL
jgi:hypothetical protein